MAGRSHAESIRLTSQLRSSGWEVTMHSGFLTAREVFHTAHLRVSQFIEFQLLIVTFDTASLAFHRSMICARQIVPEED